jgi:hypothetical protein
VYGRALVSMGPDTRWRGPGTAAGTLLLAEVANFAWLRASTTRPAVADAMPSKLALLPARRP